MEPQAPAGRRLAMHDVYMKCMECNLGSRPPLLFVLHEFERRTTHVPKQTARPKPCIRSSEDLSFRKRFHVRRAQQTNVAFHHSGSTSLFHGFLIAHPTTFLSMSFLACSDDASIEASSEMPPTLRPPRVGNTRRIPQLFEFQMDPIHIRFANGFVSEREIESTRKELWFCRGVALRLNHQSFC